ncbi:MAG: DNA translocase FtsK [Anaerolineales bacterium]
MGETALKPEENEDESLIEKAVVIVRQSQRASASLLQRRLEIGYPRAARLLDQLEEMGVVGPRRAAARSAMCWSRRWMKMSWARMAREA